MTTTIDLTSTETREPLRPLAAEKPSLIGLTRAQLGEALRGIGIAGKQIKMRVQQLWHWLYVRGVSALADMKNISRELGSELPKHFSIARPEMVEEQIGVPTIIANPLAGMSLSNRVQAQTLAQDAPSLLIACGLALRSFD